MRITQDVAEKLRAKQIANVFAKVKAGKSITAAESRLLEEAAEDPKEIPLRTFTELSIALRISRRQLTEWNKLPGAPKTKLLSEWQAFIKENGLGFSDNKASHDREYWLTEKAQREVQKLDIQLARESGSVIDTVLAKDIINRQLNAQKVGYRRMGQWYANHFGLNIEEQRKAGKQWDQIEREISQSIREMS